MREILFCTLLILFPLCCSLHQFEYKCGCRKDHQPWLNWHDLANNSAPFCAHGVYQQQIEADLGLWQEGGISRTLIKYSYERSGGGHLFKIIDNQVYLAGSSRKYLINDYVKYFQHMLRYVRVPDVEIVIAFKDRPLHIKHEPLPIFSHVKADVFSDILHIHPWRYSLSQSETLKGGIARTYSNKTSWKEKYEKAVWRGSPNGGDMKSHNFRYFPRPRLQHLSLERPDLLDVAFTTWDVVTAEKDVQLTMKETFFGSSDDMISKKVMRTNFMGMKKQQKKYKYQLCVDGRGMSKRYIKHLLGSSLAFKHTSPYYEWYYSLVKPYEHYIPFKYDLSDLISNIEWAKSHDKEAQRIAINGAKFASKLITPSEIVCHFASLLTQYSALLGYTPFHEPDDQHFPDENPGCKCGMVK